MIYLDSFLVFLFVILLLSVNNLKKAEKEALISF